MRSWKISIHQPALCVHVFRLLLSFLLIPLPALADDQPVGGAPVPGPAQPVAPAKPAKGLEDYTDQLKLVPGVAITFPIVDGMTLIVKKLVITILLPVFTTIVPKASAISGPCQSQLRQKVFEL